MATSTGHLDGQVGPRAERDSERRAPVLQRTKDVGPHAMGLPKDAGVVGPIAASGGRAT